MATHQSPGPRPNKALGHEAVFTAESSPGAQGVQQQVGLPLGAGVRPQGLTPHLPSPPSVASLWNSTEHSLGTKTSLYSWWG